MDGHLASAPIAVPRLDPIKLGKKKKKKKKEKNGGDQDCWCMADADSAMAMTARGSGVTTPSMRIRSSSSGPQPVARSADVDSRGRSHGIEKAEPFQPGSVVQRPRYSSISIAHDRDPESVSARARKAVDLAIDRGVDVSEIAKSVSKSTRNSKVCNRRDDMGAQQEHQDGCCGRSMFYVLCRAMGRQFH